MPETIPYERWPMTELLERVRLQDQMIAEQRTLIALLKEALKLQEGTCQTSTK